MVVTGFFAQCKMHCWSLNSLYLILYLAIKTLKVLVTTVDALGHFETG